MDGDIPLISHTHTWSELDIFQWHRLALRKCHFETGTTWEHYSFIAELSSPVSVFYFNNIANFISTLYDNIKKGRILRTFHRASKYLNSQRKEIISSFFSWTWNRILFQNLYTYQPEGTIMCCMDKALPFPSTAAAVLLFTSAANRFCLSEWEAELKHVIPFLFPRCMMLFSILQQIKYCKICNSYMKKFQLI